MLHVPTPLPVTTPVLLTEAMAGLLLLHAPPGVALVSVVDSPKHTTRVPKIVDTVGKVVNTVMVVVVDKVQPTPAGATV